jgi:CRP-like cAMP-binding protein
VLPLRNGDRMAFSVHRERSFVASPELVQALQPYGSVLNHPAHKILFERGQKAFGMFLLQTGSARLSVPGVLDQNVCAGSLLGVPGTLSKGIYSLTAELLEESQVLFIPADYVTKLLTDRPDIGFQLVQLLSREIQALRQWIGQLSEREAIS